MAREEVDPGRTSVHTFGKKEWKNRAPVILSDAKDLCSSRGSATCERLQRSFAPLTMTHCEYLHTLKPR